jgi:hypothetical protein
MGIKQKQVQNKIEPNKKSVSNSKTESKQSDKNKVLQSDSSSFNYLFELFFLSVSVSHPSNTYIFHQKTF